MKDKTILPPIGTIGRNILELTALLGELPVSSLNRIVESESYKRTVITTLKKQNLLRAYSRDGFRGFRLTVVAKRLLLLSDPKRNEFYLSGHSETNHIKSDVSRRERLHRIAEATVTMQNADISIFRDEKYPIFSSKWNENDKYNITSPAFYNSREIKEIGISFVKIKGARAVGVLLNHNSIFVVYNIGDSLMRWNYKSEMRTKALMKTVLCRERLTHYSNETVKGLILADNMELCYQILNSLGGKQYLILDGNYDSFYYLTNDHYGELILKMLSEPEIEERLKNILMADLLERDLALTIENDALEQDGAPVLFAFYCDLPRIKRFVTALSLREKRGIIICFDFQMEVLSRYCGDNVSFKTIDFEKWKCNFFET